MGCYWNCPVTGVSYWRCQHLCQASLIDWKVVRSLIVWFWLTDWPRCRCCARRSCRGWGCLIPWRASPAAGAAALLPSCCCSWVDATAVWSCCWRLGGSCCTPWGWGSPAATPAAAAAAAVLLVPSVVDDSALVPETHREKMFISQFWKRSQTAWIVFKILLPIYLGGVINLTSQLFHLESSLCYNLSTT